MFTQTKDHETINTGHGKIDVVRVEGERFPLFKACGRVFKTLADAEHAVYQNALIRCVTVK